MDDPVALRSMILAGVFYTAMIGYGIWQVLRLLSRGAMDGVRLVQLAATLFILGILCWVGYTALMLWT